jgi:hypothetical protein
MRPEVSSGPREAKVKRAYKRWNSDEVIKGIRALQAKDEKLNFNHVDQFHPCLLNAGRRLFGTWEYAITAAGLEYGQIRRDRFWTCDKIADQIRKLKKAGQPLGPKAAAKNHRYLISAAYAHFGSWRKAIEGAGLDYSKIKYQKEWSREKVVREIKRLKKEKLDLSTTIPVRARHRNLHIAAVRCFGSWAAAVKAAGLAKRYRPPFQS